MGQIQSGDDHQIHSGELQTKLFTLDTKAKIKASLVQIQNCNKIKKKNNKNSFISRNQDNL
jgi:hypothetical protein